MAAIPAYNEARTIGSVVLSAAQYVDEVAVVDDGSTDGTAWIAERAGATVIRHDENRGYGAAIRSCFDYARTNGTQALVILDGDGQHRPEAIPRVLKPVQEGRADISIGSRFLKADSLSKVPRYRRIGIRVLTKLTNSGASLRARVKDAQSGFRAYSRKAVDALDPRERAMGASAEILWDADKRGLKIVEVPIHVDYDVDGSSQGPVRHGLSVIGAMVRYLETERPLTVFGIMGIALFILGMIFGFAVLTKYYSEQPGSRELPFGLALLSVLFLVGGMLFAFTGLILHAVINANRRMN